MDALVVSHISALRAVRCARRAYSAIPWSTITISEQRKVLAGCTPNPTSIDFDNIARYDLWNNEEGERLHILTSDSKSRRTIPPIACHIISRDLPAGSILKIESGLYCTSPAFTAYLYSRGRSVPEIAVLLMELLGTYTLPPESTQPLAMGETWPPKPDQPESANASTGDPYHQQPNDADTPEINEVPGCAFDAEINDISDTPFGSLDDVSPNEGPSAEEVPVEQAHYSCEPAVTLRQIRAIAQWTKSSRDEPFRQAVGIVAAGSASPAESIQYCMLGFPMRHGGFNCASLPGGMLLNHQINFTHDAVLMSSGMPYAIADVYIPSAHIDIEYNGAGHEELPARIHDGNRNNGLRGMGISVIVLQRDQMRDIPALEAIAKTIYRFAQVRFRYQGKGYRPKQEGLLNALRKASGLGPA